MICQQISPGPAPGPFQRSAPTPITAKTLQSALSQLSTVTCYPKSPSFITRVCRFGFDNRGFWVGQARRALSPKIAQTTAVLALAFGFRAMSAA